MSTTHPLLDKYTDLSDEALAALPLDQLLKDTTELTAAWETRQRENAIQFYEPVNPEARQIHLSVKKEILASGGNRSSKTDTALAEMVIQTTGIVPYSLQADYPKEKLPSGPIRVRVIARTFGTIEDVIKPKLQWWKWNGFGQPGSERGHYGWIPKDCLAGRDWTKAYSEKHRTLTLDSGSTIQFMSYDQEVAGQAGASFHLILFDELPPRSHYTENKMRLLDTGGRYLMAMTPPDEASGIAAAWVYDELYEPGMTGTHPDIAAFELFTERNRILNKDEIRRIAAGLTEEERQVRLYGRFIHLSGLIHPLFTATPRQWCTTCDRPVAAATEGRCPGCGHDNLLAFCHVVDDYDWPRRWPVVFVIDPHPRKPSACTWTAVDENDNYTQVGELEASGTAEDIKYAVEEFESRHDLHPALRLMDPNAAECANDKAERGWTMRREFDKVGLRCDKAIDAFEVGKSRFNEMLRPDPLTQRPRWQVVRRCDKTIYSLARYTWDEWTRAEETRSPKPKPRDKHKDFPDCCRYFACGQFTFRGLHRGAEVIRYRGGSR